VNPTTSLVDVLVRRKRIVLSWTGAGANRGESTLKEIGLVKRFGCAVRTFAINSLDTNEMLLSLLDTTIVSSGTHGLDLICTARAKI
jgi:hypothetical protein